jgi:hypothetical protein
VSAVNCYIADSNAHLGNQLQEVQRNWYCGIIPRGPGPRWQRGEATAVHLSKLSRSW